MLHRDEAIPVLLQLDVGGEVAKRVQTEIGADGAEFTASTIAVCSLKRSNQEDAEISRAFSHSFRSISFSSTSNSIFR